MTALITVVGESSLVFRVNVFHWLLFPPCSLLLECISTRSPLYPIVTHVLALSIDTQPKRCDRPAPPYLPECVALGLELIAHSLRSGRLLSDKIRLKISTDFDRLFFCFCDF